MAVVNLNPVIRFGSAKNSANGSHSTTADIKSISSNTSSLVSNNDLQLYRSDNRTDREKFIEQMPHINPAYKSMSDVGSGINESEHVYQYLNPYRTCDLIIGSQDHKIPLNDGRWGNWRYLNPYNKETQIVPDNVILTLEEPKIGFHFNHTVESAFEGLADKGFIKNISGAIEAARMTAALAGQGNAKFSTGGKFQSRFKKIPVWKETTALQIEAALTFKFSFGQFGLFSGEWEVARPILALVNHFALRLEGNNYIKGPAPTGPSYLAHLFSLATSEEGQSIAARMKNLADAAVGNLGDAAIGTMTRNNDKVVAGLTGIVDKLTGIEDELYSAMDNAILKTIGDGPLYTIGIRVGRLTIGSIFVKDVRWSFDYSNLDEYGYPCSGEITLGDLEMIYYPLPSMFMNVFDGDDASIMGNNITKKEWEDFK